MDGQLGFDSRLFSVISVTDHLLAWPLAFHLDFFHTFLRILDAKLTVPRARAIESVQIQYPVYI